MNIRTTKPILLTTGLLALLALAACSPSEPVAPVDTATSEESQAESEPQQAEAEEAPAIDGTVPIFRAQAELSENYPPPEESVIDAEKAYTATIVTSRGDINLNLFADQVPFTVNNFVHLSCESFYDQTTFHRVINDFMAQAGDPTGTGAGGPGYRFRDEFHPDLRHDRPGILSMANAGPDTNGSQFFITHVPTPNLDGLHTVFGEVAGDDSMNTLFSIRERDPQSDPNPGDVIVTIIIDEDGQSFC